MEGTKNREKRGKKKDVYAEEMKDIMQRVCLH